MQEFIEWCASFASEGETTLIVKQKPKMAGGEAEKDKDGNPLYTWPAFMPERWTAGQAWYGNTGCFILDRFRDGKPSASQANSDYPWCMIFDDIGTKSKEPPLTPTWKIETSPGNQQWGVVYAEQPTAGEHHAMMTALADAGYTDRGALNAVRNFRLPGSVNLKPTANKFQAKLLEWNKSVELTVEQICAACEVTPGEASSAIMRPIQLKDDGTDDVLAWLGDKQLVLERANSQGWYGVVCPNHANHTDGNPMGRYHPTNRAYMCFHGHCTDWDSKMFLNWVSEQGGPEHEAGLRPELLAAAVAPVIKRLEAIREEEGSQFSHSMDASEQMKAVEKAELGRLEMSDWFHRFAYIESDDSYFDLVGRRDITRRAFDSTFAHIKCNSVHAGANGGRPRCTPSKAFDERRKDMGARILQGLTYAPGEGALVAVNSLIFGNKWIDARGEAIAGDIRPWMDLVETVVPNPDERNHLLDMLAYKVQHPERKINHALLLAGNQGVGKDTMLAPFKYAIGGRRNLNIKTTDEGGVQSQFTYAFESEVLMINEIYASDFKDARALQNILKPVIAAPPEFLTVNRKHCAPYEAVNRVLVIASSNHRNAIALPADDRRWFVIWSEGKQRDLQHLWGWMETAGGFEACAAFLRARDVSAFNPGMSPPMTDAKRIMALQSMSSAEEYVVESIRGGLGDFQRGFVGAPWHSVCDRLQGSAPERAKITRNVIMHALEVAGWKDMGLCASAANPNKRHIYARPDIAARYTKADLRNMIDDAPQQSLVRVK